MPNFLNKKNKCITYPGDVVIHQNRMSMTGKMVRDKAFFMAKRFDGKLYDAITGTPAQCTISGTRYGIVNGVVTAFAPNVPSIEGNGLRGCPAFTQLARYTEDFTNAAWSKSNILTPTLVGTFQGQNIWGCTENTATNVYHSLEQTQFVGVGDNSVLGLVFVAKAKNRKLYIDVKYKNGTYRGTLINLESMGEELTNPTTVETQNIDANNYTSVTGDIYTIVSSGTYCQFSWPNKLTIGKTYEFLPTIIGTPIGSIKEQSTDTVLTHGVPIRVTATGTQIAVARATACNVSLRLSVREVQGHTVEVVGGAIAHNIKDMGDGYRRVFVAYNVGAGAYDPYINIQLNNGTVSQYTGDGISGIYLGQPTYINFGVNGVPFIPPYVPNNTTSSVSVVSEAATASTGTSFDLDDAKLIKFKEGLRGKTVETELTNPTTVETQNIDANNYTSVTGDIYTIVSSGTYCQFSWPNKLTIGKTYEFLPTIIGTPIGSIKEQSTNTVLTHGVPIRVTATGTQIAVARATACNVSLRLSVREVQAQGHIELEFESNVDSGWLANNTNINILSVSNSNLPLYYRKNTDGTITTCNLYDGTNLVSIAQSLTVGQTHRIYIDYGTYTDGTQKMRLTVNGVKSSVVDFSGSWGAQDLRFFFGNTVHAGWIRNLKYYERPQW